MNSFATYQKKYKIRSMFYGMVTVEFEPSDTYALDTEAMELYELISGGQDLPAMERNVALTYASLTTATHNMSFHFTDEVPDEYRALEVWWSMIADKIDPITCFLFYKLHVPNDITAEWITSKNDAGKKWKPVGEKSPNELTESDKTNPNLRRSKQNRNTK